MSNTVSVADMTAFDIFTNFSFNLFPSVKKGAPPPCCTAASETPKLASSTWSFGDNSRG